MDNNTVIEGTVKFRDGKKWKSRWCVMRKLSPVADCLHLQLYRDSKDRYKQGQTKASLSLQHFLGVESGFTLDKESNTIAIICQDVTVILAFDSRERLIQWQVKISNNLGEDQQFLIQISSAPPKAKIASGPARLHVQDQRFCITVGVPPRLVGFWEIGQLRRYGVVEGRFCFEGGSRCGKGEGLHVCVTDQGEEITHTFQLAAQGKLASRRRPVVRKMSAMDSPRKQLHSRAEVRISDLSCADSLHHHHHQQHHQHHLVQLAPGDLTRSLYAEELGCCCSMTDSVLESSRHLSSEDLLCPCRVHNSSPFWSSAESSGQQHADLDSNYGCGDTSSVSELADAHYHHVDVGWADCDRRPGPPSLERCASCIGKLGAPSMSRSSTATNTPGTPFSPAWTMDGGAATASSALACAHLDRASLSSHGSSGGHSSDCSAAGGHLANPPPREPACWYDKPRAVAAPPPVVPPKSSARLPHPACHCCPPARPPKPTQKSLAPAAATAVATTVATDSPTKKKAKKPPMPLPVLPPVVAPPPVGRWLPVCTCHHQPSAGLLHQPPPEATMPVGPYENYDVPKSILGRDHKEQFSRSTVVPHPAEDYYDTPKSLKECLVASGSDMVASSPYSNYDTPPTTVMMKKPCGCVVKYSKKTMVLDTTRVIIDSEERTSSAVDCPCRRVMCWAENFMMIPYCRRGNGMENTGVPIHKVKLSGEGKMPVVNTKGEIAIYATIDKSKKTNRKQQPEHAADVGCESHLKTQELEDSMNYVNVTPGVDQSADVGLNLAENVPPDVGSETCGGMNYENIEFAQSLEYYENSRDVLSRAGITPKDTEHASEAGSLDNNAVEGTEGSVTYTLCNGVKFCNKCGHACHYFPAEQPADVAANQGSITQTTEDASTKQDDYLMMEPGKTLDGDRGKEPDPAKMHSVNFPGYLPMSPITNASSKVEVLKMMSKSLSTEKSASSPSLTVPASDRSRKRSNSEFPRIPGSAMMMNHSANSPYMRRMLFESNEESRREYLMSRKRSSSADSSRYLDDFEDVENASVTEESVASSHENTDIPQNSTSADVSDATDAKATTESESPELTPCSRPIVNQRSSETVHVEDNCVQEIDNPSDLVPSATDRTLVGDSIEGDVQQPHGFKLPSAIHIRRSSSVPCKSGNNRDSSSSNDSGVSTDSLRHRGADFAEFELPLTTAMSARRHYHAVTRNSSSLGNCLHASLPRRSKSVDPLRELSFQFQKIKVPAKSSSAEAEVPICPTKGSKGFASPGADGAITVPYIDSRSTSSGTSDMSDYIETLSLSSHSSSDTPGDSLRLGRPATTTLRPRSGKEYQLIDRSVLENDVKGGERSLGQLRGLSQYANIAPLLEKSESPSPGYMSGSPGQEREEQPLAIN